MSRQKATFDDRLESLVGEATTEQLHRMQQLAAMLIRINERRENGTHPAPKKRAPKEQKELPLNA